MKVLKDIIKVLIGSGITAAWFLGVFFNAGFFIPAFVGSTILLIAIGFWIIENWDKGEE